MLMNVSDSGLLVVDVQERLCPAVDDWQRVLDRVIWLVRLARQMHVPVMVSEQYPKGLGRTHPDLVAELPANVTGEKLHFSCAAEDCLAPFAANQKSQLVICGMEAHVCVFQSAVELATQGRSVFVVADAVTSRNPQDKDLALERMRRHGIEIVSAEMVAFEWLRRAGTDQFREISRTLLR
jgi:nicotinamidase-related amidase